MRDWSEYIRDSQHWLTGVGYNDWVDAYEHEHPGKQLKYAPVNTDEKFFVVANNRMCFVIKMSAFKKMSVAQRNKLYAIADL